MAEYWHTFDWDIAFLVFASYLVVDVLFAYYTYCVVKLRPFRSATAASSMYFLMAVGIVSYVGNPLYLIPLAIGSWIGTYVVVWREKRNEQANRGSVGDSC